MKTDRGFDRLINFSDAVVAIAISLLILPVIDQFVDDSGREVRQVFADEAASLFAFFLSFVVIARFWLVHHRIFERVSSYTTPMILVNMFWLLAIVFVPLPTQLAGNNEDQDRLVYALYIGTLVVISATPTLLTWTMQIAPETHVDQKDPPRAVEGITITVMLALALLLAVTVPNLGMAAMFVVFLTSPIERYRHQWLKRRAARPLR